MAESLLGQHAVPAFDCRYFNADICRSCEWLNESYENTLQQKQRILESLFPGSTIHQIQAVRQIAGSRVRAKLAVFGTSQTAQLGFFNASHQIAPVDNCPLHHQRINDLVGRLPALISQYELTPYEMSSDRGELKFVVITHSPTEQQLMLQLVLRSREAVDRVRRLWTEQQRQTLQDVAVLSVNLQPTRSSNINGPVDLPISDQEFLAVRYGTTNVYYRPSSFIQTNFEIAARLYQHAGELIQTQTGPVLDLYCGTGAFSLTNITKATPAVGIDVSGDSIRCAQEAASDQGLTDAQYFTVDELSLGHLVEEPFGTVICNPPRRGLDDDVRKFLQAVRADQLVYSSCNPETLQRDIRLLTSEWELQTLTPFDMFPYTRHQEVLAQLMRRGGGRDVSEKIPQKESDQ